MNTTVLAIKDSPNRSAKKKIHTPPVEIRFWRKLQNVVFFSSIVGLILFGWMNNLEDYITAEEGIGYWLGITGGSLMLLLLLYPLRKRLKPLRTIGSMKFWFRFHMLCGIFGPILILYHSNFKLGSTNSNVALFCMLVVAGSGLIGRYLYSKIHYGLYGTKASFDSLRIDLKESEENLAPVIDYAPELKSRLQVYEKKVMNHPTNIFGSLFQVVILGIKTRWSYFMSRHILNKAMRKCAKERGWGLFERERRYRKAKKYIANHLFYVRKIAGLSFFERMFSLWHVLHIPLFVMLLFSGIFHVIAVHMY